MDNIDRFIRVLYKDCNLRRLFQLYEQNESMCEGFTLTNEACKKRIVSDYQWLYPNNYNEDSLAILLKLYTDENKQSASNTKEKCDANAIILLQKCVDKMLVMDGEALKVKFEFIQEWDGLTNKIDSNILIGLKCALQNSPTNLVFSIEDSVLFYKFNDNDKPPQLKELSENHMHLKASGYTTEMSIQAVLHCPITSIEAFAAQFNKLNYDDRFLGTTVDEAMESIRKIKLIRIFLYDMQQTSPYFTASDRRALIKNKYLYLQTNFADKLSSVDTLIEAEHISLMNNEDVLKRNPTKRYFILSRYFFFKAFQFLFETHGDNAKESKSEYQFLLNMYISGVSKLRFLFVQDNNGMGFSRFKRYENRKTEILGHLKIADKEIYASVFDKYIQEKNVKQAEFRIAPSCYGKGYFKLFTELERLQALYIKTPFEYGIIVHFIKSKDEKHLNIGIGQHRYEKYLSSIEKQWFALLSLLENNFSIVKKIIGIDAANFEIDCPPEVFAGIFGELIDYAERYGEHRLYTTYHVGEDFRNVVTGLRRIDEAIEFLKMQSNDRLGHAMAAGINLEQYFLSTQNNVTCTLQEWIDDLAWMHNIIFSEQEMDNEQKIVLCSYLEILFGETPPEQLVNADKSSQEVSILEYFNSIALRGEWIADKNNRPALEQNRWLWAYFNSKYSYEQGSKPFVRKISKTYVLCAKIAQELVVKKIINKNIIIEANPSSNRKIFYSRKNSDLPAVQIIDKFSLQSAWNNVCINTDDSAIFQTNLNNEYMILFDCYKNKNGKKMIETLARNSLRVSFIGKHRKKLRILSKHRFNYKKTI